MKINEAFRKIFFPPAKVLLVIDLSTVVLLIFALGFPQFAGFFAYVIYTFSTYALTATVIGIKRLAGYIKHLIKQDRFPPALWLKTLMHKNKYTARYLDDKDFRAEISLYAGLAINLLTGYSREQRAHSMDLRGCGQ